MKLFALLFTMLLCGCAGNVQTGVPVAVTPATTSDESPPVERPTPSVTLTNQNWNLALSDADRYAGAPVNVVGRVFAEKREGDAWALQIWTDFEQSTGNTMVVFRSPEKLANRGDHIRVVGTLGGLVEGTSTSGVIVRLPRVFATQVQKVNPVRVQV